MAFFAPLCGCLTPQTAQPCKELQEGGEPTQNRSPSPLPPSRLGAEASACSRGGQDSQERTSPRLRARVWSFALLNNKIPLLFPLSEILIVRERKTLAFILCLLKLSDLFWGSWQGTNLPLGYIYRSRRTQLVIMLMKKILTMVTKDRYLSLFQRVHLA